MRSKNALDSMFLLSNTGNALILDQVPIFTSCIQPSFSSFHLSPGLQYGSGAVGVTSIVSVVEKISMFLVKIVFLLSKV